MLENFGQIISGTKVINKLISSAERGVHKIDQEIKKPFKRDPMQWDMKM